jgi:hypothetical protein
MRFFLKTIIFTAACITAVLPVLSVAEPVALPEGLSARVMLVRIGADNFEPIRYADDGAAAFESPLDIARTISADNDWEPLRVAEIGSLTYDGKSFSGETKSSQTMHKGLRKLATNTKEQKSYYLTEYIDFDEKYEFKLKIFLNTEDPENRALNCQFSFSYEAYKYIPYEQLGEQTTEKKAAIAGDRVNQTKFEASSTLAAAIGETVVVSTQKIEGDYRVLLLNISHRESE